jgi:hypothetical protein
MYANTASKDGTAPIQFTISDTALREPYAGLGEWAVKWKLPQAQFISP